MPSRSRPPQALLVSPDEIERQFYEALQSADLEKLMAVWSDDDDIVCVHPGGPRVLGAHAIRASFEAIFKRGGIPVRTGSVRRIASLDSAVHNLIETVTIQSSEGPQQGFVVATNVYAKTTQGWRLVAHHASPGSAHEPGDDADAPSTLH
jgi:uncharacterized protein (TIGR02246 family)